MLTLGTGALAGISFASNFLKGYSAYGQAKQEAAVYGQQAASYQRNAARVRLVGSLNENIARSQQRAYIARGAAAAGEAGMGESPTTAAALATSYAALEQNILNQRYQVESEAENYLYQARVAEENARQLKKKGKNRFTSGLLSGINGALNVYGSI